MKLSEEKVMRAKDALEIIFPNMRTRRTARLFIDCLKSNNDLKQFFATKTAVSKFADSLQEGIIDAGGITVKFSRVNFYGTIVKTLIDGGFIQKNLAVWDTNSSRTLFMHLISSRFLRIRPLMDSGNWLIIFLRNGIVFSCMKDPLKNGL